LGLKVIDLIERLRSGNDATTFRHRQRYFEATGHRGAIDMQPALVNRRRPLPHKV
jgi:hypothetical protein